MAHMLRGALIEYGSDFLGPLPNIVLFQFNPETMSRTIQVPQRPTGAAARETSQAGEPPVERITIKAEFSAADALGRGDVLARATGIGPQLAALEKMVFPTNILGGLVGAAIDAIGDALGAAGGGDPATQPIPREKYPRILFIWGLTRALPVVIESMSIVEQKYDALLNPVQAEVSIGLAVVPPAKCSDDVVAKGAYEFTSVAKEAMAALNLANTVQLAADILPF
ncbi:MAG: hypothetical protein IRY94_15455 [Rhodospirillaceae bacterium]|nr:hypothetical protein [Rhodospirillaceae bacterium]